MPETPGPPADFSEFEGNPDFVLSLARGLSVIEAFQELPEGVTNADIAGRTGLSRAAVRRLLLTLEMLGYAARTGSVYKLSSRVLRLGTSYLSSSSISTLALPVLEEITAQIHESSSVSVLEEDQIVYVARSAFKRVMSVGLSVGSRLPAYCASMGRVLLAALPDKEIAAYLARVKLERRTAKTVTRKSELAKLLRKVREQGFSMVDQELEIGLRSLAVPIRTRTGRVVAAMNTGVQAARVTREEMIRRFLPVLRDGARLLGQSLG